MCDYSFHGVVFDVNDSLFEEIPKLPEIGVPTLKLFMAYKGMPYHCDDASVFKALQAAKDAGVTIMVHAENADIIDVLQKQCLARGEVDPIYHAVSRLTIVETECTQRAISLAEAADAPIFVVHVTEKGQWRLSEMQIRGGLLPSVKPVRIILFLILKIQEFACDLPWFSFCRRHQGTKKSTMNKLPK